MAARKVPHTDLLLTVMGAPHESDLVTSLLRLVRSVLDRGGSVQVWACGYATMLTQASLGETKPRNLTAWSTDYPSTAAIVRELLTEHPERLFWYGCRFCGDERGATEHLPEVVVRSPGAYLHNVAAADKTVLLGVI